MEKKTEFYNTKHDFPGGDFNAICVYCGKELKPYLNHNNSYFWHCDCADANKEQELRLKIQALKKQMPKPKYEADREWKGNYLCAVVKEIKLKKNDNEKE